MLSQLSHNLCQILRSAYVGSQVVPDLCYPQDVAQLPAVISLGCAVLPRPFVSQCITVRSELGRLGDTILYPRWNTDAQIFLAFTYLLEKKKKKVCWESVKPMIYVLFSISHDPQASFLMSAFEIVSPLHVKIFCASSGHFQITVTGFLRLTDSCINAFQGKIINTLPYFFLIPHD